MKQPVQSPRQLGRRALIVAVALMILVAVAWLWLANGTPAGQRDQTPGDSSSVSTSVDATASKTIARNPLTNKAFYNDDSRQLVRLAADYRKQGKQAEADLLDRAAKQPGTVWLFGPNPSDTTAERDVAEAARTSRAAKAQGTVPLYQLYALPNRDACAGYSKGGFRNDQDYLDWVDRIVASLQTPSVVAVEADAVAQTVMSTCLSPAQADARYALINKTVTKLQASPNVVAVYLDAGHSEWFSDPAPLVEPLRKSGIDKVRGVAVNVSNFVATPAITAWSQRLVELLGGNKGVLVDTSRNGQGSVAATVTGDARWCNPSGRGLGPAPTTSPPAASIDAYAYIKNVGESDGDCFGNPPAGTFVPAAALELAKNARQ